MRTYDICLSAMHNQYTLLSILHILEADLQYAYHDRLLCSLFLRPQLLPNTEHSPSPLHRSITVTYYEGRTESHEQQFFVK